MVYLGDREGLLGFRPTLGLPDLGPFLRFQHGPQVVFRHPQHVPKGCLKVSFLGLLHLLHNSRDREYNVGQDGGSAVRLGLPIPQGVGSIPTTSILSSKSYTEMLVDTCMHLSRSSLWQKYSMGRPRGVSQLYFYPANLLILNNRTKENTLNPHAMRGLRMQVAARILGPPGLPSSGCQSARRGGSISPDTWPQCRFRCLPDRPA